MTRNRTHRRTARRLAALDALHFAAILACTVWTAKLIVEERFGGTGTIAMRLAHLGQDSHMITIRLDESARTAAR